jgi:hypothetical protein
MSISKTKKKSLAEMEQSKPVQLQLFELADQNLDEYSNTIELYDVMPKYFFGGVEREKGRLVESLPILAREFVHRGKSYKLNISPAAIIDKKNGKTINYYPSQREELVEDVLRKLAAKQRGIFLDGEAGVKFTLYEVQKELEKIGHGYNINEIKQAIEICSKSVVEVASKDGNEISYTSNIFPFVGMEKREMIDGSNKAVVMFHPLVTRSINEGTYRLINYEKLMKMKMPLARWLHKRISHLFSQATVHNPYEIKLSTIIRDSGMKEYKTISERIRQVSKAVGELVKSGVLANFEIRKNLEKNKILDATFSLYVSEEFVADVKKANAVANLKLKQEKISDITGDDLTELRAEMSRDIFGLSQTFINGRIGKVASKKEKEEILLALKAAEEYISKKNDDPDFHPAKITMAALKNKYLPKSALVSPKKTEEVVKPVEPTLNISGEIKNRDAEWKKVRAALKKSFGEEVFDKWLSKLELLYSYEMEVIMQTPTKFLRDWIKREYLPQIKDIWQGLDREIKRVSIVCVESH